MLGGAEYACICRTLLDQGCPNFDEIFLVLQYMKKLGSSPSEHFFGH